MFEDFDFGSPAQASGGGFGMDDVYAINQLAMGWYTLFHNGVPPQSGSTGGSITVGRSGAAFSISPSVLIVGAIGLVALVLVLKR